jgi:hypothetical protein
MSQVPPDPANAPLLAPRVRLALWISVVAVLGATFFAYDQIALATQWVVMKLC